MFQLGCVSRVCFKNEILSGLTVALALVPEAVAFSFVAGVEPLVGLYAAFMVGLLAAIFGGRPGMISGATGAMAVVMVSLKKIYFDSFRTKLVFNYMFFLKNSNFEFSKKTFRSVARM